MVKFLPEPDIQYAAQDVITSFERKHGSLTQCVPIDDLVEQHLGVHLDVFDNALLPEHFHGDVLGYIDLHANSIGIHESILPENSGNEGRYNFTLGHEAGHFVLHREQILANAGQFNCFEQDQEQTRYMAKRERDTSSGEWQADCFSSYLNMPTKLVHKHWLDFNESYRPLTLREIAEGFRPESREKYPWDILAEIRLKKFAKKLRVSPKALLIRLKKMELITEHKQFLLV